jgi:hypothetical protein
MPRSEDRLRNIVPTQTSTSGLRRVNQAKTISTALTQDIILVKILLMFFRVATGRFGVYVTNANAKGKSNN